MRLELLGPKGYVWLCDDLGKKMLERGQTPWKKEEQNKYRQRVR